MWTKKKKKSSLNIKQGPETRDGRGEGGGGAECVSRVF